MRGPIPKVLGDAYRDVVDLVTLESDLKDKDDYWFVAAQVHSARLHGVLPKTIVASVSARAATRAKSGHAPKRNLNNKSDSCG